MTSHKNLDLLASENGCKIAKITYRFQGIPLKRKGFDVIDAWNSILLSIEPIDDGYANRWIVRNYCTGKSVRIRSLDKVKNQAITPGMQTGYKLAGAPSHLWEISKELKT